MLDLDMERSTGPISCRVIEKTACCGGPEMFLKDVRAVRMTPKSWTDSEGGTSNWTDVEIVHSEGICLFLNFFNESVFHSPHFEFVFP